jgi:hypothetical protein
MPCNFEVNLITRLGVIPLFSSFFSSPDPKGPNQKKELFLVAMFIGQMERNGETL